MQSKCSWLPFLALPVYIVTPKNPRNNNIYAPSATKRHLLHAFNLQPVSDGVDGCVQVGANWPDIRRCWSENEWRIRLYASDSKATACNAWELCRILYLSTMRCSCCSPSMRLLVKFSLSTGLDTWWTSKLRTTKFGHKKLETLLYLSIHLQTIISFCTMHAFAFDRQTDGQTNRQKGQKQELASHIVRCALKHWDIIYSPYKTRLVHDNTGPKNISFVFIVRTADAYARYIAIEICLSVRLSIKRVHCDKRKNLPPTFHTDRSS